MLLDVSADHVRRDLVTHRASTRAIFPECPAPQAPRDPWERAKDGPGTHTLDPGDDVRDGVPGREGAQDMDMVRTHLHLCHGDGILLRHIGEEFPDPLWALALSHVSPVLGRPDEVVQGIVDGMGCTSQDHTAIVHPQPALGRGH
jgi:hypothetical protein